MSTDDNSDFVTDDKHEAIDEANGITPAPVAESETQPIWARRTVLKAAALGTAAAALVSRGSGGLRLGPLPAAADDLSGLQCTANDVRIKGTAQVLNEPCDCPAGTTFTATVAFTVENNAASARTCITLHLIPVEIPGVGIFDPGDVLLQGSIAGKTTTTMTGEIKNYPCGAGRICFGSPSDDGRGRCEPNTCAAVSYGVPSQDTCPVTRQISSKCRHQQICIQGRGSATLDCDTSQDGVQTNCQVDCGGTTKLRLCTSGGPAPYTFELTGENSITSSNLCETFEVGPISEDTTFTGKITDSGNPKCTDTVSVTLTVADIVPVIDVTGDEGCNSGVLTFTASFDDLDCVPTWSVDGTPVDANADGTLTFGPVIGTSTIGVSLDCGGCEGTASVDVTQCVSTTVTSNLRRAAASAQKSKKQDKGSEKKGGKRGRSEKDHK